MTINKWILALAGTVIVVLLIIVIFFRSDGSEKKPAFDPSFEMIDPKNPRTQVDNILQLKRENDALEFEKCLIDQLKPFIEGKRSIYGKEMAVPPRLFEKTGKLTTAAFNFLNQISVNSIFDFDFDAVDNCSSNQSAGIYFYTTTQAFKLYDNIRRTYAQQVLLILSQSSLPLEPANVRQTGGSSSFDESYYNKAATPIPTGGKTDTGYDRDLIKEIPTIAKARLDTLLNKINARLTVTDDIIKKNKEKQAKLVDDYTSSRLDINDKAIRYGIIAFCFTAISMYIAGILSRGRLKRLGTDPNPNFSADLRFSMWNSVYLITVLLLIITIFILGLARLLTENSLAALLGSIAGYVLNSRSGGSNPPGVNPPDPGAVGGVGGAAGAVVAR